MGEKYILLNIHAFNDEMKNVSNKMDRLMSVLFQVINYEQDPIWILFWG